MLKKGDKVLISGLHNKQELNGKYGKITDGPLDSGRCVGMWACTPGGIADACLKYTFHESDTCLEHVLCRYRVRLLVEGTGFSVALDEFDLKLDNLTKTVR